MPYTLENLLLRVTTGTIRLGPYRWVRHWGSLGGRALSGLGIRRKVAEANLRATLGLSGPEARRTIRRSYANFCSMAAEFLRQVPPDAERIRKYVKIANPEILTSLRDAGRGAVMVTGHFGNWELLGMGLVAHGFPFTVAAARMKNPGADKLIESIRTGNGIKIAYLGEAAMAYARALKSGDLVAFLSDQDGGKEGAITDFLGVPASTSIGAQVLAFRLKVPFVCGFAVRQPDGLTHVLHVMEPIWPKDFPPTQAEAVQFLTDYFIGSLGEMIRKYPDHYFWAHRRFKSTRPDIYRK